MKGKSWFLSCYNHQLDQILQDGHKTSVDKNAERLYEENNVQDTTASIIFPQEASDGLWSCQQLNGKKRKENVFMYVF